MDKLIDLIYALSEHGDKELMNYVKYVVVSTILMNESEIQDQQVMSAKPGDEPPEVGRSLP